MQKELKFQNEVPETCRCLRLLGKWRDEYMGDLAAWCSGNALDCIREMFRSILGRDTASLY
jgi:hypothetical protein